MFSKCICHRHCICLRLCCCLFVGQVMFSHSSDQMSQRPKVSKIALLRRSLNVFVNICQEKYLWNYTRIFFSLGESVYTLWSLRRRWIWRVPKFAMHNSCCLLLRNFLHLLIKTSAICIKFNGEEKTFGYPPFSILFFGFGTKSWPDHCFDKPCLLSLKSTPMHNVYNCTLASTMLL